MNLYHIYRYDMLVFSSWIINEFFKDYNDSKVTNGKIYFSVKKKILKIKIIFSWKNAFLAQSFYDLRL
jgi:hypothetical protein